MVQRTIYSEAYSYSAFNAIISASVVALGVSYAIPPAINCLRGRKMLPPRPFVLPGPLGWFCNLVGLFPLRSSILLVLTILQQLGIVYVIVTTVLFLFPPDLPVTGSNMSKPTPSHCAPFGSTILIFSARLLHSCILYRYCNQCYSMVR